MGQANRTKGNGARTKLADLKPDEKNLRSHDARNIGMITDALNEVGAARSIVIDDSGNILAGNGTVQAAQAAVDALETPPAPTP